MDYKKIAIVAIILITISAICVTGLSAADSEDKKSIDVYAGAGFSKVMPDLVAKFNEKYPNIEVNVKYGGSGELFSTIETQKAGDVFMPATYKYMGEAMNNSYMKNDTVKNITENIPVIVVQKGNPHNIKKVADLANPDIKVGIGAKEGPAIGKNTEEILEKNNISNLTPTVTTTTVNQLLTYMASGQIDATIIWKDMTVWEEGKDKIDVIEIPENQNKISTVPIGILKFTKDQDSAQKFEDFIVSEDAKPIWEKWGFEITS
ncbi:molybdate ABC transporter substrate-binding protein [Methanobrevibacter olleyae]|uniref:Molybdate ABC transporter substrate-binding protein n=1 Tax=Methanobrevibacter olleyae TaxID=294671 RepID=A0A126QXN7_METOL|nr:molybdate ABC transporter substrate-binding protein [Methanobrevibacter olleyae]AMK14606.1 molybdate ABC transporter substrate-binding protein [Methanobrevibacter olleyae]SFL27132.1 molybdate transport system substrate-binding protein [Methanobrevibacter olleyae]